MTSGRIVIFTRYPTPGEAKTRLIPALGAAGAAALHRRLAERTLHVARDVAWPVELRTTGARPEAFRGWLGDVESRDQGEGDLGQRLRAAAAPYPVILIGTDAPGLRTSHIRQAIAAVEHGDVAIGPAEDGGYWLIGLPRKIEGVFDAVPWSTEQVFPATTRRLAAHGVQPVLLECLTDIDRPEDLARWPDLVP